MVRANFWSERRESIQPRAPLASVNQTCFNTLKRCERARDLHQSSKSPLTATANLSCVVAVKQVVSGGANVVVAAVVVEVMTERILEVDSCWLL